MTAERIVAYLDGGLSPEAREGFERHLLLCSECRQALAEASDLTGRGSSRWFGRVVPIAAAAAAMTLFWIGASEVLQQRGGEPTLRGPAAATQLGILSPLDGSMADPDSLVFRWRTASVDAHYVFTLTDANGDVVFTKGQADTTLVLPRSVGLDPGVPYFWFVDALLDGARSTSTGVQEFVVERR